MKAIYSKLIGTALIATVGLMSVNCTRDFEEINDNPNSVVVGDRNAESLLEPLMYEAIKQYTYYNWYWNNELMQYTVMSSVGAVIHRYIIYEPSWASIWTTHWTYAANAQHIIEQAVAQNKDAEKALAMTFKVWLISNITDLYGDIPYSEALMAREDPTMVQPVFDSQKDVYLQMFDELEEANEIYATSPSLVDASLDGLYGGDMTKWRKFNNSLYLRLLCRISGRDGQVNVVERINKILDDSKTYPVFASAADNATMRYTGTIPYVNYFAPGGRNLSGSVTKASSVDNHKMAENMVNRMVIKENGADIETDPRLPIMYTRSGSNPWTGLTSGVPSEDLKDTSGNSLLNTDVLCRELMHSWFMTYDELLFIKAEAAIKGWISGGEDAARTYYEDAVTASINRWAEFATYTTNGVDTSAESIRDFLLSDLSYWDSQEFATKEELILTQKYISLFWIGFEAFHEYRRTGYPELPMGPSIENDGIFPQRFGYPQTCISSNNTHVQEALQRMGGSNDMKTPVWWSKRSIESGIN